MANVCRPHRATLGQKRALALSLGRRSDARFGTNYSPSARRMAPLPSRSKRSLHNGRYSKARPDWDRAPPTFLPAPISGAVTVVPRCVNGRCCTGSRSARPFCACLATLCCDRIAGVTSGCAAEEAAQIGRSERRAVTQTSRYIRVSDERPTKADQIAQPLCRAASACSRVYLPA